MRWSDLLDGIGISGSSILNGAVFAEIAHPSQVLIVVEIESRTEGVPQGPCRKAGAMHRGVLKGPKWILLLEWPARGRKNIVAFSQRRTADCARSGVEDYERHNKLAV